MARTISPPQNVRDYAIMLKAALQKALDERPNHGRDCPRNPMSQDTGACDCWQAEARQISKFEVPPT